MTETIFNIKTPSDLILKVRQDTKLGNFIKSLEDNSAKLLNIPQSSSINMGFPLVWEFPDNFSPILPGLITSNSLDLVKQIEEKLRKSKYVITGDFALELTKFINLDSTYYIYPLEHGLELVVPDSNICIQPTIYSSIIHVLLNITQYTRRFCWDSEKKKFYGSSMFFIELDRLYNKVNNDIIQANLFYKQLHVKTNNYGLIHKGVHQIDLNIIKSSSSGVSVQMLDDEGYMPIERAIYLYILSDNQIIEQKLIDIIEILSKFTYRRSPKLFVQLLHKQCGDKKQKLTKIIGLIDQIKLTYSSNINSNGIIKLNNILEYSNPMVLINSWVVYELLNTQPCDISNIFDYIKWIEYKNINYKTLLEGPKSVLCDLIPQIYSPVNKSRLDPVILLSEQIKLLDKIPNQKFSDDFIKEIIPQLFEKSAYISIVYLTKSGYPWWDYKYPKPLFHYILESKYSQDYMTIHNTSRVIMAYVPNDIGQKIIMEPDDNNYTPLHKLALGNPELVPQFIDLLEKLGFTQDTIGSLVSVQNSKADTFLHILARKKQNLIVSEIIEYIKPIINLVNNNGETPLIITARNKDEELYKLLKSLGASESNCDNYGNTVFHYICMNEMFLGSEIIETENSYGFKPSYYTTLSNYWVFLS